MGVEGMMLKQRQALLRRGPHQGRRHLVEVEDRPVQHRRSAHLCATRPRPARQPLQRLHLRGVGRARKSRLTRKLVPFAKAYSGLTDEEMGQRRRGDPQDHHRELRAGAQREAHLVFELGFEGINRSGRHKSGIAVRFPRMLRWRDDKPVDEADTLETLAALLPAMADEHRQYRPTVSVALKRPVPWPG
jgi:DNA ligase-1